jgi:hypothetical protein
MTTLTLSSAGSGDYECRSDNSAREGSVCLWLRPARQVLSSERPRTGAHPCSQLVPSVEAPPHNAAGVSSVLGTTSTLRCWPPVGMYP